MNVLGALALSAAADGSFFTTPPHRSGRPARRHNGDLRDGLRNLMHSIRRALADATEEPTQGWLPTIRDYPY